MSVLEHIDDLAELYALGTLGDAERERVDAHLATCEQCAARVGEAEAVVAALVNEELPPRSLDVRIHNALPQPRVSRWLGPLLAAALVLGLLPSAWLLHTLQSRSAVEQDRRAAIIAMLHSHFTHAQFTAIAPDAPKAKVLFARGASWCYVVAQTTKAYDVRAETAQGTLDLGTLRVNGDAAELFVPRTTAHAIVLLDGSRAVARARLPYRR